MMEYDTFILTDLNEVREDVEQEMIIRDLTPGRKKYRCEFVKALISKDSKKYPECLWPRLGQGQCLWPRLGLGQWVGEPWSIKIAERVEKIPERFR
jgi:hypothetical protein